MESEILAIAIVKPFEGREDDVLALLNHFYAMLARKGYSRDILYRSHKDPSRFFHLRYWKSNQTMREASEDPDVHHYWHQLTTMGEVETVYEQLEEIPLHSVTSL
jgi:quinol monooxygenase YgiN